MKLSLLGILTLSCFSSPIAASATPTGILAKSWEQPSLRVKLPTSATHLKFSPDGENLLMTDTTRQSAELWNLTTGKRQSSFPAKAGFAFCDLALSADGQFAAALLYSRETPTVPMKRKIELKVWNLKTGQSQWASPIQDHAIQTNQAPECQVEFSPNGQILAASVSRFTNQPQTGVRLWNPSQGRLLSVTSSTVTSISQLAFSPDSSVLGFSTRVNDQAQIHLWDLRDRKLQATLKPVEGGYSQGISAFLFSPNQQDVIAYTYDGGIFSRLYRWQVKTGKLKGSSVLPPDRTDRLLGLSPDGETYVYGGDVTGIHIGNLRTGQSFDFPQELRPAFSTTTVVFSPDGQQMAIGDDRTIAILR